MLSNVYYQLQAAFRLNLFFCCQVQQRIFDCATFPGWHLAGRTFADCNICQPRHLPFATILSHNRDFYVPLTGWFQFNEAGLTGNVTIAKTIGIAPEDMTQKYSLKLLMKIWQSRKCQSDSDLQKQFFGQIFRGNLYAIVACQLQLRIQKQFYAIFQSNLQKQYQAVFHWTWPTTLT